MSKSNYRRCVGLGVTGKNTSTCFPASIDKIIPHIQVPPDYYLHYEQVMRTYNQTPDRQKNPILKKLYDELGDSLDADDFIFLRVKVADQLREIVGNAMRSKLGIVIDVNHGGETHSLGLELVNRKLGHFVLNSTHVPKDLWGPLTVNKIYKHMAQPDEPYRVRYPFNDANITLIGA